MGWLHKAEGGTLLPDLLDQVIQGRHGAEQRPLRHPGVLNHLQQLVLLVQEVAEAGRPLILEEDLIQLEVFLEGFILFSIEEEVLLHHLLEPFLRFEGATGVNQGGTFDRTRLGSFSTLRTPNLAAAPGMSGSWCAPYC